MMNLDYKIGKTLGDALPHEFSGFEFSGERSRRFAHIIVTAAHDGRVKPWPGREKFVLTWYELENGYAVGWNENPSRGWSFPVVRIADKKRAPKVDIVAAIVTAVTKNFRCFGGWRTNGADFNPIVAFTKDDPPSFAAGVDVADVVRFVLDASRKVKS